MHVHSVSTDATEYALYIVQLSNGVVVLTANSFSEDSHEEYIPV
jgi:hypothetical protein